MNYGLFGLLGIPTGIDAIGNVSRAVQGAADNLETDAPQIADFVREAAQTVERLSNDLRERSLGEIAASVSNFAREEPVAFFGGAVLAGFILARLSKHSSQQTASYMPRSLAAPYPHVALNGNNRAALRARSL
jgi:ABC-type transporter Mla subunit MlaD